MAELGWAEAAVPDVTDKLLERTCILECPSLDKLGCLKSFLLARAVHIMMIWANTGFLIGFQQLEMRNSIL